MCRNYGPNARTALQVAIRRGWCKQESFTDFLNAALHAADSEPITRATVANWSSGRENMPADAVLLLAEHCGAHAVDVINLFLRGAGFFAEPLPEPTGTPSVHLLDVLRTASEATPVILDAADSPAPTPEEWARCGPHIDRLDAVLRRVKAHRPKPQVLLPFEQREES
jgi:hypothetical protein